MRLRFSKPNFYYVQESELILHFLANTKWKWVITKWKGTFFLVALAEWYGFDVLMFNPSDFARAPDIHSFTCTFWGPVHTKPQTIVNANFFNWFYIFLAKPKWKWMITKWKATFFLIALAEGYGFDIRMLIHRILHVHLKTLKRRYFLKHLAIKNCEKTFLKNI